MTAAARSDPRGLATLAQTKGRDLRPALLYLHTQSFADAPSRSRALTRSYEALALGLIPLVSADVLADIRAILAAVPDAPDSVTQLLAASAANPDRDHGSSGSDLGAARDVSRGLDAHRLRDLVSDARADRVLAEALLARPDLSVLDRAALYRFADDAARDAVRSAMGTRAAVNAALAPHLDEHGRASLVALARARDLDRLLASLGRAFGTRPQPSWTLDEVPGAELFALSLVAAGLGIEDCIRVFLTADPAIARSVPRVFGLSAICRATSPGAALALVRCALGEEPLPVAAPRVRSEAPVPSERARRAPRDLPGAATAEPGPGMSGPADRRATATTGRNRT